VTVLRTGAAAVLALLATTACSGPAPAGDVIGPPPTPSATGSAPTTAAPTTTAPITAGTITAGPITAGAVTTPPGPTAPAATRCTLADLGVELGAPEGPPTQPTVRVIWTNTGDRECTMTGFGGADLRTPGDSVSLRRAERPTGTVRLPPGGRAQGSITFLPVAADAPGAFPATELVVTPPDETRSASLPWTAGPVLRQDGATRPGTYLGPVEPLG
jgi:hypothetical protein